MSECTHGIIGFCDACFGKSLMQTKEQRISELESELATAKQLLHDYRYQHDDEVFLDARVDAYFRGEVVEATTADQQPAATPEA